MQALFRPGLQRKLWWIVVLAVAVPALVTIGLLAVYESNTFQPRLAAALRADAQMMAEMIQPAIEFDDADTAGKQLATLRQRPELRAAAVYLPDGRLFATYERAGLEGVVPAVRPRGARQLFDAATLWVLEPVQTPVVSQGEIWLSIDLPLLSQRLYQYGAFAAASSLSLVVLALLLFWTLRRAVAGPITALVQTAQAVSEKNDYTLRVPIAGQDEFGRLGSAFNEMLAAIGKQNQEQGAREARLARQNQGLVDLARTEQPGASNLAGELRMLTEIVARVHAVERASVWFFTPDRTAIRCEDIYQRTPDRHGAGDSLAARDFPAYFAALAEERMIAVEDVATDSRTSGLGAGYLQPHGIGALLDVPIRWRGKIVGVLSHEHTGGRRVWQADEISFAVSSADRVALGLEAAQVNKAENALRESEASYRALIEEARDAIFTLSREGRIEDVNQAGSRITGWDMKKWIGQRFQRVLFAEDVPLAEQRFAEVMAGRHPESFELRIPARPGGLVVLEFALSPLIRKGEVVGLLGIGRDVTERKRAAEAHARLEEQLFQAQKMEAIGTLAGGVAHDFNNILTGISGNTQLVMMDLPAGHPAQEGLKHVIQASQRAKDLVNQILTFSRRQEQRRAPLQVHTVVEEALKLLRPSLPATIEIATRLEPAGPPVLADATQLHQVLMNLATNAAAALAASGGRLEIIQDVVEVDEQAVRQHPQLRCGRFVRLVVSDTGCGMDAVTLERIFDPFFTTKAPGRGTGLGLAVVHGIVQQHEGIILVYSDPGKGTTFQVYLPVCAEVAVNASPGPAGLLPRGQGERILVVDDEELVLRVAVGMLGHLGYRPSAHRDGFSALQALRGNPGQYDLVMTDLTMPKMTGVMLAAEIRRVRPDIPIVLCTGFGGATEREEIIRLGLRGPLLKPFLLEGLALIVAESLRSDQGRAGGRAEITSPAGG
jgi:PAS domain S-box-containing protein